MQKRTKLLVTLGLVVVVISGILFTWVNLSGKTKQEAVKTPDTAIEQTTDTEIEEVVAPTIDTEDNEVTAEEPVVDEQVVDETATEENKTEEVSNDELAETNNTVDESIVSVDETKTEEPAQEEVSNPEGGVSQTEEKPEEQVKEEPTPAPVPQEPVVQPAPQEQAQTPQPEPQPALTPAPDQQPNGGGMTMEDFAKQMGLNYIDSSTFGPSYGTDFGDLE